MRKLLALILICILGAGIQLSTSSVASQGMPFPGPGMVHSLSTPFDCGFTGSPSGTDSGDSNAAFGIVCTPASSGTVTSVTLSINSMATGNIAVAIYAMSGGHPNGNPLCSSGSSAAANGANTISCSTAVTGGADYFIAFNSSSGTTVFNKYSAGCASGMRFYQLAAFPAFPDTTGSLLWNDVSVCFAIYMSGTIP